MAPLLHMKHLLILAVLLADSVLVSAASAQGTSNHNSHGSIHVEDDEGGYGHFEEKSRDGYGKTPMNDDDDDDKQGYGQLAPKKNDDHKRVYIGKPMYNSMDDGSYGKLKKLSEVVPVSISVEGVVSCQDCKYVGTDSLTDARVLAAAQVKLACQTGSNFFYATATTDSEGSFLISVPHFDFQKFSPAEDCMAFLVSSPLEGCSTVTDINNGKTGNPLQPIPTFAPSSNLMYSAGPFAFAPELCSSKP